MKKAWIITGLLVILLLLVSSAAYAQATGYTLPWWSVDGGGGHLSGSGYSLNATLGQPDAGRLTGSGYVLAGGFWAAGIPSGSSLQGLFLPLVGK